MSARRYSSSTLIYAVVVIGLGLAGGALGAALVTWHDYHEQPRQVNGHDSMRGSYLGPRYSDAEITAQLDAMGVTVPTLYKQYAERFGITEEEVRQRYVDQVPMKRGCTYDDVANLVIYLASDQSNYTTGQALNVTGGQEMH